MDGTPNFKNRTLCHGDNLPFLRGMNSKTIDLIATDPPFNKGRDFHATPDSLAAGSSFQDRWAWDDDAQGAWLAMLDHNDDNVMHVVEGSRKSYGDDMGAFLCFMAVRLIECRRILKDTGSIYLHCDPTASHYLKELMDAVFGRDNFRNEIVWKRATAKNNTTKKMGIMHDTILYYVKTTQAPFYPIYLPHDPAYIKRAYRHQDKHGRFRTGDLTAPSNTPNADDKWRGISPGKKRSWNAPVNFPPHVIKPSTYNNVSVYERLDILDKLGLIYWPKKTGGTPQFKRYFSTSKGRRQNDMITDITHLESQSSENTGYATQKPVALYERFIIMSSKRGDFILDPFCGCATTCVAAEKLGRQWIGIDLWDKAHECVIQRLEKEGFLARPGQVRQDILFTEGEITYTDRPFARTDDMMEGAPYLKCRLKNFDTSRRTRNPHSREEMIKICLDRDGPACQGCGITLPARYYELDHKSPRADGGSDLVDNRLLLCAPCNRLKSNNLTISGIRRNNKKAGFMVDERKLRDMRDVRG